MVVKIKQWMLLQQHKRCQKELQELKKHYRILQQGLSHLAMHKLFRVEHKSRVQYRPSRNTWQLVVLYNGSASALVSVTAPTLSLEPPGGEGYPRRQGGEQDAAARSPRAARALNRIVPRTVLSSVPRTHEANSHPGAGARVAASPRASSLAATLHPRSRGYCLPRLFR